MCEHHLAVEVADTPQPIDDLAVVVESLHLLVYLHEAVSRWPDGAYALVARRLLDGDTAVT